MQTRPRSNPYGVDVDCHSPMPSDVRSFSAGSTASGRTAHTGRSNHTGLDDSKSLKAWARGVAEDVLALRREFEALRASGAGRPNLSRPDSWELPSPAYAKLPGRRLGKAGVSMREAAFAIGMSPARQPPGISPIPCTNAMLLGGARDDEETVRWPSQGAHGPEPPEVPEVPDSDFWDNRLQAVEGEVTRLGEEFRRLEGEQQHATRQRGDLRQENELLLSRLSALEGDKAHTGAQVQELHALLSALDRGARGLSEDLTCVVQEVELRLAKIGHELASQKSALQQVQSEMMSPATPDMAPVPVVVVVERLCASNPRMQRSEATRLCQSFRAWQGIVRPPERLRPSAAASMPMIEQHLQQRFEWLEQRALLSARCEVLRQREELCLAVGAELHEANHAHFEIDEAKVLKLSECLSEVQQRVEGVEASLPQLVSQVSCLSDRCAALGQEPRHPAQALNPTPESLNAVRSDVGAVARSVAQLDEVFREALELNEIRDSKVEELRQVLSEVAEASAAPEDAIARQAVQVVWQSVEELQAQATESQASKDDVAKDLDTLGADLALLKAQASGQVSLSRSVEELREVCQEDRRSALKAEESLRDACARVEGLEEAVTNLTASHRKSAKAADVNDLRHSLAELQEVFREAEQKTAAEARSNLDHVHFRVQELSEAVSDVKQEGQDTAKAADVNDLRHSLAELQEVFREAEQKTATEARSNLDHVHFRVQELSEAVSDVKQEGQDTAKAADVNDLRHSLAELQEVFREAEQKTAAEARSNLDHVRFRVQELSEAVSDVKQEGQDTAKAADVNDLRHSLAELQEVFREAEQKTAAEVCSNLDHVRFRVQELSEAVTEVKQVGQDTAKAADVNDLRHSLAELQEVFREAEQKTATEARSNLDHVRFRVQELSEAVTDVKQVGPDTAKAADVSDLRHSLAELQEVFREAEQKTAAEARSNLDHVHCRLQELSEVVLALQGRPSAASELEDHQNLGEPKEVEEQPLVTQWEASAEPLPAHGIYQGKPRDARPRTQSSQPSGLRDGSPKGGDASGSIVGDTLSTNPAMASSFERLDDTFPAASAEEHFGTIAAMQDELKLLAFEAQRQRRQSIKMHAELGQALASLEEQQLQRSHAEQDLWAHLQVHERQQQHVQDEVQSALAELAALRPGCQRSVAEALASLEEQQLQRSHAEQVLVETVQADAAETEAKVQSLKQEVGCAAEDDRACFLQLWLNLNFLDGGKGKGRRWDVLSYASQGLTDADFARLDLRAEYDSDYEEVDFSENNFSGRGLRCILDLCVRCPRLKVLKLFKNDIDDEGAEFLARFLEECPNLEELHLSHNRISSSGALRLISTGSACRREGDAPLWLRLERNCIENVEQVESWLYQRYSVCYKKESECTSRHCKYRCKVHVPHIAKQSPSEGRHRTWSSAYPQDEEEEARYKRRCSWQRYDERDRGREHRDRRHDRNEQFRGMEEGFNTDGRGAEQDEDMPVKDEVKEEESEDDVVIMEPSNASSAPPPPAPRLRGSELQAWEAALRRWEVRLDSRETKIRALQLSLPRAAREKLSQLIPPQVVLPRDRPYAFQRALAEELQAGFTELRMSLSDALEVDMRPAQQIQSEQLAQTEASVVALRGALSLELGEAKRMLSEEMASQVRSMSEFGRALQWQQVLHTFAALNSGITPNNVAFSVAIRACSQAQQWPSALALFADLRARGQPDLICWSAAMSGCAAGSLWRDALQMLRELPARSLKPDIVAFGAVATACSGAWSHAVALLEDACAAHLQLSSVFCNSVITACGRGERWELALSILNQMPSLGAACTVVTYTAAMTACTAAGHWQRCLQLGESLTAAGIAKNVVVYGCLVDACESGRQWILALQLLREMPKQQVAPNLVVVSAAIGACESCCQWETAWYLFCSLDKPNVVAASSTMAALAKGGRWEMALSLCGEARDRSIGLNLVACSTAISACEKGHNWASALALLLDMRKLKLETNIVAYSAVISACEKSKQWELALALFEEVLQIRLQPDVIACSATMSAVERSGRWDLASGVLSIVEEDKIQPNVVLYNSAISAAQKANAWEKAIQLMKDLRLAGLQPNTISFSAAILACSQSMQWLAALQLLAQEARHDVEPNLVTYGAAIESCEQIRNQQHVPALLRALEATGLRQL
ncbi:unnamed protein product [Symbiodinium natans]|uniref:Pentatricopeptide repeat-containing protein, chloroplastic n=1 Tax=Symbiodinium natans TaxID=878477 RepID=A0A812U750_9DINO|nr:unnamed protein product [Symbiodinium natans]